MKIIEYNSQTELYNDLKYWCNALGELHHHGEYDIEESELPTELKRAYEELWTDGNGSLCYLVEYKGNYSIALVNEFDDNYADDANSSMEELCLWVHNKAKEFSEMKDFEKAIFLIGENTGCDECHEFITILPWDVSKSEFDNVSNILYEKIYG